jgi:methyltransferase
MPDTGANARDHMIDAVRRYFDACNGASRDRFAEVLAEGCVHYFPPGAGGPYQGRDAIADLWIGFVATKGSCWTIDRVVCDGSEIAVEWTHFKPAVGERIRGSEWYEFDDDGKIVAIWAHYASPRDTARAANELEGFPYGERGYPHEPPALSAAQRASREGAAGAR